MCVNVCVMITPLTSQVADDTKQLKPSPTLIQPCASAHETLLAGTKILSRIIAVQPQQVIAHGCLHQHRQVTARCHW